MGGTVVRLLLMSAGALSALFAGLAVFDQAWELVYAWLGAGLLAEAMIHAGPPAGGFSEDAAAIPSADGRRVVGALAYLIAVFMPVIAMLHAGFLDGVAGVFIGGVIVLSGLYRLGRDDWAAKVAQFDGFPAAWAGVGFTLHAFDATPLAASLAIGLVVILGLLPVSWPHPLQANEMRQLTRVVSWIWLMAAGATLWHGFPAFWQAKVMLMAAGLAGLLLTALLTRARAGIGAHSSSAGTHVMPALDASDGSSDPEPR